MSNLKKINTARRWAKGAFNYLTSTQNIFGSIIAACLAAAVITYTPLGKKLGETVASGMEVKLQREVVEVMRPCPVTVPTRPETLTADALPADARDAARVLTAKLLEWQGPGGYGDRAASALEICTREQP